MGRNGDRYAIDPPDRVDPLQAETEVSDLRRKLQDLVGGPRYLRMVYNSAEGRHVPEAEMPVPPHVEAQRVADELARQHEADLLRRRDILLSHTMQRAPGDQGTALEGGPASERIGPRDEFLMRLEQLRRRIKAGQ